MTDQEIIDHLMKSATYASGMDLTKMGGLFSAAAERIRVLGEEVEAWRKRNAILTPREYERALADVVKFVAATDAARRGA